MINVMNIDVRNIKETSYTYHDVTELLHEAFQERLEQGLKYTCSFITEEQFRQKTADGIVYVALNNKSGLCGTATLTIKTDKKGIKYGYFEYNGIRSDMKGKGIGTMLYMYIERESRENGCEYLLSDTSIKATSAVKYHLKNGFKIIGFESYRSTNYWSYVFRKQLVPSKKWDNPLYCKLQYIKSWLFIKITRDINGNDTALGRWYKLLKRKCKNLL